jgi:hypothetical protein
MSLTITNSRVLSFYEKNPLLDFNSINLHIVDLLESVFDKNSLNNETIATKILNQLHTIRSSIVDDISNKIDGFSKEKDESFFNQLNNSIETNSSAQKDKLESLINNQISSLNDKLSLYISNLMPKHHDSLKSCIDSFKNDIKNDINNINPDNNSSFLSNFENKYQLLINTLQQNIQSFIRDGEGRFNEQLSNITNNQTNNSKTVDEILNITQTQANKYKNSTRKGQGGENNLETILNNMFPSSNILRKNKESHCCDIWLDRQNKDVIMFENKEYETNTPEKEVTKFLNDIEMQKQHGIFLSQTSGISKREHFEINIHHNYVTIFLHNVNYDFNLIRSAIQIVDMIAEKLKMLSDDNDSNSNVVLDYNVLQNINQEFFSFSEKKRKLRQSIIDSMTLMKQQIDDLDLSHLERELNRIFSNKPIENDLLCCICKQYQAKNSKALITHQNSCKKKHDAMKNAMNIET